MKRLLAIIIILYCSPLYAENHNTFNNQPNIQVNPTIQNTLRLDFTSHIKSMSNFTQQTWQTIHTTFEKLWQPEAYKTDAAHFLSENKWTITALLISTHYGYCYYRLYKAQRFLHDQTNWAHWQDDLTLEELTSIPKDNCTQQLIHEIQMRYASSIDPTDFVNPLALFLQQIDLELMQAKEAHTFFYRIDRYYLSRLFPNINIDVELATESLNRLLFIKQLFLSWMAHYNIEHNKKKGF